MLRDKINNNIIIAITAKAFPLFVSLTRFTPPVYNLPFFFESALYYINNFFISIFN